MEAVVNDIFVAKSFTVEKNGTDTGVQIEPIYTEDGLHIPIQTMDGKIYYMLISTDVIDKMILDFIDRQNKKND